MVLVGSAITNILQALHYVDGSIYFKLMHMNDWTILPGRCPNCSMGVAAIVQQPLY